MPTIFLGRSSTVKVLSLSFFSDEQKKSYWFNFYFKISDKQTWTFLLKVKLNKCIKLKKNLGLALGWGSEGHGLAIFDPGVSKNPARL